MKVPELLREARKQRGWSQSQLAAAARTTQPAVARWESGRVSPRVDSLRRVLEAAGFVVRFELEDRSSVDFDQITERLRWTPLERLSYLRDMVAFEDRARRARIV